MAKKKPQPAATIPEPYIAASITYSEAATSRTMQALRPEEAAKVARCMQLSVANACAILSRICANQRIRLYAPAGTQPKARRVRGVKAAWLAGDGPHKHGRKAMEYAGLAGECEEVLDHPILDLIHDPDPFTTQTDWFRLAYWFLQSTGKTYIYTGERLNGVPTSLYLLASHFTRPEVSKTAYITSYKYGRDETSAVRYPAEEVIYLREMVDPNNPTNGISWVQSIGLYADNEHAAVASEVARWANGGIPGAIFRHPAGTNPTTMKQTEAMIDASSRGVNKAGKNLYIRDLEVIQHATKPHEMNYLPGIEQAERAVYRAAGIPEAVWKLNDANLASASAADPQFMAYTVQPIVSKFAEGLTEWLCPLFDIEPGQMWFAADNAVSEDVEASALRVDRGFVSGYVFVNEARAVLGLDPVDEKLNTMGKPAPVPTITLPPATTTGEPAKGDKPATDPVAAVNDAADPKATSLNGAQVTALQGLQAAVAAGLLPLENAMATARAAFPAMDPTVLDGVFAGLDTFTPTKEPDATGKQDGAESGSNVDPKPKGDPPANGGGTSDKSKPSDGCVNGCGGHGPTGKAVPRWNFEARIERKANEEPMTPLEAKLNEALKPILESAYTRIINGGATVGALNTAELNEVLTVAMREIFAAGATEFATAEASPVLVAVDARDYAAEYSAELVTGINETTRDQIQAAVVRGIEEGKPLAQIQDELRAEVPTMSDQRAEMIARTETGRAADHGAINQAAELGYSRKGWILSGNACGLCEALAAGTPADGVPINGPYYPAGTTIVGTDGRTYVLSRAVMVPTDAHPNCSCGPDIMLGPEADE